MERSLAQSEKEGSPWSLEAVLTLVTLFTMILLPTCAWLFKKGSSVLLRFGLLNRRLARIFGEYLHLHDFVLWGDILRARIDEESGGIQSGRTTHGGSAAWADIVDIRRHQQEWYASTRRERRGNRLPHLGSH